MLDTLRLVHGSVSTKDLMPVMKHFYIYQQRIQGQNGRVALDAPLPGFEVSLTVPADRFIKAIDACDDDPDIKITESKVTIKAGRFRATLPIMANDAYPRDVADERQGEVPEPMLPVLRRLSDFISDDASHIWSLGVKICDGYAYATNNVLVGRCPLNFPTNFTLPIWAIDEMVRIGEEPTGYGMTLDDDGNGRSITFYYAGGVWLKAYLIPQDFPNSFISLFDEWPDDLPEIPPGLKSAVERISPFCPNPKIPVIVMSKEGVSTDDGEQSAVVDGFEFEEEVRNNSVMLLKVLAVADRAKFESPRYRFSGPGIVGIAAAYRTA